MSPPHPKEPLSEDALKKLAEAELRTAASASADQVKRYERIQMTVRIIFAVLFLALVAMMFYAFTLLTQISQRRPSQRGTLPRQTQSPPPAPAPAQR